MEGVFLKCLNLALKAGFPDSQHLFWGCSMAPVCIWMPKQHSLAWRFLRKSLREGMPLGELWKSEGDREGRRRSGMEVSKHPGPTRRAGVCALDHRGCPSQRPELPYPSVHSNPISPDQSHQSLVQDVLNGQGGRRGVSPLRLLSAIVGWGGGERHSNPHLQPPDARMEKGAGWHQQHLLGMPPRLP